MLEGSPFFNVSGMKLSIEFGKESETRISNDRSQKYIISQPNIKKLRITQHKV